MKCPKCGAARTQTKGNRYLKSFGEELWRRTNWRKCPKCKVRFTVRSEVVAIRMKPMW